MKYLIFSFISLLATMSLLTSCSDDDDTNCVETEWFQDSDGDGLGDPDVSINACDQPDGFVADNTDTDDASTSISVNESFFASANPNTVLTIVDCTLSDGSTSQCYQITTSSTPVDHELGPWCPDNIADDDSQGGIWLDGGVVYDVDGAFVENLATFYNDDTWMMFDGNGDIFVTETEDDCINAANPNVGAEYANFCVECLPSYITDLEVSFLIPVTPVWQDTPVDFLTAGGGGGEPGGGGPGGPGGGGPPEDTGIPSTRGVGLNGVEFSAPAPTDNILSAYTLAPFDDAGGHINVNQGYHYHAATGVSFSIEQEDGHAPLIGYAMDGYAIYSRTNDAGEEPTDLDDCRGHSDDVRGYHYHVDAAGNNNFINCLHGAFAE